MFTMQAGHGTMTYPLHSLMWSRRPWIPYFSLACRADVRAASCARRTMSADLPSNHDPASGPDLEARVSEVVQTACQ